MRTQTHSILTGAAVAALLTLPAQASDWTSVNRPAQSFPAQSVTLDRVAADVTVDPAANQGSVTMSISGPRFLVDEVKSKVAGEALTITGPHGDNNFNVWDWSKWFDYSHVDNERTVKITLVVPHGSALSAKHMVGDLTVGNLDGTVYLETASGDIKIGNVGQATVKAAGSGDIQIGAVHGLLDLQVAGSGDIKVGSAQGAKVSIAGSGDASMGAVNGRSTPMSPDRAI